MRVVKEMGEAGRREEERNTVMKKREREKEWKEEKGPSAVRISLYPVKVAISMLYLRGLALSMCENALDGLDGLPRPYSFQNH